MLIPNIMHISEENVKEFSRKINNLNRMQIIITEDLLQSLAAQILRKELIQQEELAYLLAKSKVLQSAEQLLPERPIAQKAPEDVAKKFNLFDSEAIAEIISQAIANRLSAGVSQGTISASLANVVSTATQPVAVAAVITSAQHKPVPTTLTSTNRYTNAMLQSAPVKNQHQQALALNEVPAKNSQEQSKASQSRIALNTITGIIDNIGKQAANENLQVRTTELSPIGWMLFDIINEIFGMTSEKQSADDLSYGWDPRLLCQRPALASGGVNNDDEDKSFSF